MLGQIDIEHDLITMSLCPVCDSVWVTIGRLDGPLQPDDEAFCSDCLWRGCYWQTLRP